MLEVAAGTGNLTEALVRAGCRVAAVELDERLAALLRARLASRDVAVIEGDLLERPPAAWLRAAGMEPPFVLAGNLPYRITSPALRWSLSGEPAALAAVFLVQREVAESCAAAPPRATHLGSWLQALAEVRLLFRVPAGAFTPPPKVESAALLLRPRRLTPERERLRPRLEAAVHAAFRQPRKRLRNSLADALGVVPEAAAALLVRAGIDPAARPGTLDSEALWRLAVVLATPAVEGDDVPGGPTGG